MTIREIINRLNSEEHLSGYIVWTFLDGRMHRIGSKDTVEFALRANPAAIALRIKGCWGNGWEVETDFTGRTADALRYHGYPVGSKNEWDYEKYIEICEKEAKLKDNYTPSVCAGCKHAHSHYSNIKCEGCIRNPKSKETES